MTTDRRSFDVFMASNPPVFRYAGTIQGPFRKLSQATQNNPPPPKRRFPAHRESRGQFHQYMASSSAFPYRASLSRSTENTACGTGSVRDRFVGLDSGPKGRRSAATGASPWLAGTQNPIRPGGGGGAIRPWVYSAAPPGRIGGCMRLSPRAYARGYNPAPLRGERDRGVDHVCATSSR
jgi:hypothetical protein